MPRAALDVERLRELVGRRWPRIDVVEATPSTNADLLARRDAADRTVLAAELQTSGRGRLDRTWTSPSRAGLTFSVLTRPGVPMLQWGWIPLLAGVALAEGVRETTGVDAALKWPNDLLVGDPMRKAAGILVQSSDDVAVIGIGLNVSTTAEELPVDTATSLALAGAGEVDRTALLAAVLARLDARLAQWVDHNGDATACGLADAYRTLCATIGSPVRITVTGRDPVQGDAVGVDLAGHLVVRGPAGEQIVGAGDVEHLRTL